MIDKEIKAKIFAQYAFVAKYIAVNNESVFELLKHNFRLLDYDDISDIRAGKYPEARILVIPLSNITDEDAIEVAKMAMIRHNRHYDSNEITYSIKKIQKKTDKNIFYAEVIVLVNKYERYVVRLEENDVCTSDFIHKFGNNNASQPKDYFTPYTFNIAQYLQSKGYALPYISYSVDYLIEEGVYKLIE